MSILGKTVAATFAASRETNLHIAGNGKITFTERFQSLEEKSIFFKYSNFV
jgi:hypothetical protein